MAGGGGEGLEGVREVLVDFGGTLGAMKDLGSALDDEEVTEESGRGCEVVPLMIGVEVEDDEDEVIGAVGARGPFEK